MKIPEKLLERLEMLGMDETVYDNRPRKCLLSREQNGERVAWYNDAYYVDDNPGNKDSLVFDPVSIVPCIALEPKKSDRILDMCAAPGTKTFIISFMTGNKADVTANDVDRNRLKRLAYNASKYGINCVVTNKTGRLVGGSFNKILVDAPCSGEGMISKKEKIFKYWSERRIRFLAKKQKKLVKRAFEILEDNGILVYSTCTFAPEENEGVVDFILKTNDNAAVEEANANIKHSTGITEWNGYVFGEAVKKCMRIYPNQNGTGGFFVAKIRKNKHL